MAYSRLYYIHYIFVYSKTKKLKRSVLIRLKNKAIYLIWQKKLLITKKIQIIFLELDKKLSWLDWELNVLDKKAFLDSYQDNCCLIINSNNQKLIYHIHCFRWISYHQSKTRKSCWFHKFLFYDFYFEPYSLNVSNIFY